jgi:hypothetical protein
MGEAKIQNKKSGTQALTTVLVGLFLIVALWLVVLIQSTQSMEEGSVVLLNETNETNITVEETYTEVEELNINVTINESNITIEEIEEIEEDGIN